MRADTLPGFLGLVAFLVLSACSTPAKRLDRQARELGLQAGILDGRRFRHKLYRKGDACRQGRLHVYLEGDGLAWLPGNRVALDPTPPKSCLLPLMARDSSPAVYLGRPCYHGFADAPNCRPALWTRARYGQVVTGSMVEALGKLMAGRRCRAVLIGFSGGGALAMLIASRIPERIAGIVTLAGNLNVDDWTRRHGYSALDESEDPARRPPLPPSLFQIHVAGGKDDNISYRVTAREVARNPGARFLLVPRLAHECPGPQIWQGILTGIAILEQK